MLNFIHADKGLLITINLRIVKMFFCCCFFKYNKNKNTPFICIMMNFSLTNIFWYCWLWMSPAAFAGVGWLSLADSRPSIATYQNILQAQECRIFRSRTFRPLTFRPGHFDLEKCQGGRFGHNHKLCYILCVDELLFVPVLRCMCMCACVLTWIIMWCLTMVKR